MADTIAIFFPFATKYTGQPNGINDCFSKDLLQEMNNADIMMINNEFTYSTRGEPLAGKDYTFRADPKRVDLLETFGTDIVSLPIIMSMTMAKLHYSFPAINLWKSSH